MVLSFILILGTNIALDRLGLLPEPQKEEAAPAQELAGDAAKGAPAPDAPAGAAPGNPGDSGPKEPPAAPPAPVVPEIGRERLLLGSVSPADGYPLEAELDQRGAGLWRIRSSRFDAEYEGNKPRKRPLTLVQGSTRAPLPLAISLLKEEAESPPVPVGNLESRPWDVLIGDRLYSELDAEGRRSANPVRPILDDQGREIGQAVSFRTFGGETGPDAGLIFTKTFRLLKGRDAVEMELVIEEKSEGRAEPRKVAYRLQGPYGIPIEGEWYTYTFRNAYLAKNRDGGVTVETHSSYEVASEEPGTYQNTQLPLAYAGVENQYFAVFVMPQGKERLDARTSLLTVGGPVEDTKKADLTAEIDSKPVTLEPGKEVRHTYLLVAGAKTPDVLEPYGAEELANYRTIGRVPIIGFLFDIFNAILNPPVTFLSKRVISPLLGFVYGVTKSISGWFGGTRGSYGIAIILLTVIVRLGMFPLSRKQAISAKRMQELQPHMTALREKYKDDKEKIAQETFALYRKHGINPLAGCLPVMVQIPIFMALWRTLNVSVALRQAPFLWMDNLAAPDMLFSFGTLFGTGASIPLLGPYFNLLPLVVVALMFVQTKLFAPPATTPEQEMQQKVMKYMMVFMAVMFYRVPSGLSVYFITSSVWSICERLLLPKLSPAAHLAAAPTEEPAGKADGKAVPAGKATNWLAKKLEALMEEAEKEKTYRRQSEVKPSGANEREGGTTSRGSGNGETSRGGEPEVDPKRNRPKPDRTRPPGKRR